MVVQHNLKAMNSNRMLGITQSTQAKSTEKLSSGYKINRAADDAAGLSISEKMRKQIRGLTQASTNAQDGISAVQTAEGALNEVQDMLQRMNELAVKAANGTNSSDDRSYIQDEINQLTTEIDRVAETTKFNETYLLKGTEGGNKKTNFEYKSASLIKTDVYYMDSENKVHTLNKGDYAVGLDSTTKYFKSDDITKVGVGSVGTYSAYANSMTNLYSKGTGESYTLLNPGDALTGDTIYYSGTFDSTKEVQSLGSIAGSQAGAAHYYNSIAAYDSTGNSFAASKYDLGTDSAGASNLYSGLGSAQLMKDPIDFNDITEGTGVVQFKDADGNEVAANGLYRYIKDDGTLKDDADLRINGKQVTQKEIDNYVNSDPKYTRGTLTLKLHVGADATDNNQITVDIDAMSTEQLGIKGILVDGKDDTNARNAIETIKEALQRVSTQRSALGAVQNRLEHTINNLDNVVENTTSAESGIRDTDMATEMVKYSNNNILAQAGQAMLAQANQSNQGVLSLLG